MDPIFYFEKKNGLYTVPKDEKHHIEVLRIKLPSQILFTDCSGYLFKGYLNELYEVDVIERMENVKKEFVNVYFGICEKSRMKFILEKCTELGVKSFNPVITEKSDQYPLSFERANGILVSAIKQSRRYLLPIYNQPVKLEDIDSKILNGMIFGAIKGGEKQISQENIIDEVNILIGPPSGFTENEEDYLMNNGANSFYFNTAVLRTETFTVALLSIIHYLKGVKNG